MPKRPLAAIRGGCVGDFQQQTTKLFELTSFPEDTGDWSFLTGFRGAHVWTFSPQIIASMEFTTSDQEAFACC